MSDDGDGIVWPNDTHRVTIIGKTGSGKTQGACWLLAHRSYDTMPWIILNWKHDPLLNDLPGTQELRVTDKIPKRPGLYMAHPLPSDADAVDDLLWRAWERENVGIYIDEGYMISPRSAAFQAVLTQGRSKRLPVIMGTQRPAWVTRFAFSEADYIQLYQLTDIRDTKTVKQFMPLPIETRLPARYYSWWWDNARNYKAILQPVPDRNTILDVFYSRMRTKRRAI